MAWGVLGSNAAALDGGALQVNPRNGWRALEVISQGEDPDNDGYPWAMPGTFDGLGAWLADDATVRVLVNHEINDAAISELNLDRNALLTAISHVVQTGTAGGTTFVRSARQAYRWWSPDGGENWYKTRNTDTTSFARFCSGQAYSANTFGSGRGFADPIYITGEEFSFNRLFALDLLNRNLYQLSGAVGAAPGGIGGMPFDSWENAALLDTGETHHVALLLSPDGGTQRMQLYVGEKGKDRTGAPSTDFLARNGLAYGSYYYLNDRLPTTGTSTDGFFDTTVAGALTSTKLEDVDASPVDATRFVLGDQDSGLFTFDLAMDFSQGRFNPATSSFSITKIQGIRFNTDGAFGEPDNVDWTDATSLGTGQFPDGLIFVNEDSGTENGEIWMMRPDGSDLTLIADTVGIASADETSGILDISDLLGYHPGSIVLTSNQGMHSSLTVLVNPDATAMPEPSSLAWGAVGGIILRRHRTCRWPTSRSPRIPGRRCGGVGARGV